MRHVDDAHGAEGDGEPDRRQQQHRAQRDAVPDVLRHLPGGDASGESNSAPAVAASLTSPSDDAAVACSTARASRSPRSRTSAMASTFCAAGASEASTLAARASLIERLMRASFSPASAWSRAASEEASRRLKRASAAPRRTAGSGLIRVSEPTAASMMPRSRLLTRTRSSSASDAAAGRLAGDRLGQRELVAVGLADEHEIVGLADIELARGQRLENGGGAGVARCRQRAHRGLAIAETAGGEVAHERRQVGGHRPCRRSTAEASADSSTAGRRRKSMAED